VLCDRGVEELADGGCRVRADEARHGLPVDEDGDRRNALDAVTAGEGLPENRRKPAASPMDSFRKRSSTSPASHPATCTSYKSTSRSDGTGSQQLTHTRAHDSDPEWLPPNR